MAQLIIATVGMLQTGPLSSAISKQFYLLDYQNISDYFSTCINISVLITLLFLAIGVIFSDNIITYFNINFSILTVSVFCAFSQCLMSSILVLLQMARKPFEYLLFQVGYTFIWGGVTLYLYFSKKLTIVLFFLPQMVSVFLVIFFFRKVIYKIARYTFSFNYKYCYHIVSFSFPIIIYSVGSYLILLYLRKIIDGELGIATLGIFTIALQIGMVMENSEQIVIKVWQPYIFQYFSKEKYSAFVKICVLPIVIMFFVLLILLAVNKFSYEHLISRNYNSGYVVSALIIIAFFMKFLSAMVSLYGIFHEKMKVLGVGTIFIGVFSLYYNTWLIKNYGLNGAGYGLCLSYFFVLVLNVVYFLMLFYKRHKKDNKFEKLS